MEINKNEECLNVIVVLFVGDAAATVYSCSGGKIKIGALQTKMVQAKTCIGGTSVTYTCTGGTGMTSTVVPHAPDCRPGSPMLLMSPISYHLIILRVLC